MPRPGRPDVEAKMAQSDATLKEIQEIVLSMYQPEYFQSTKEWETFQTIKNMVFSHGTRHWATNPPWMNNSIEEEFEEEYFD